MNTSNAGFTIVEVLIVTAMLIILSVTLALNFQTGDRNLAIDRAAHSVSQDIREAIGFTLGTKPHNCGPSNFKGYGVHFKGGETSYITFADCNGNRIYQAADLDESGPIELETGFRISSATPTTGGKLNILFSPPEPEVWINNALAAGPAVIVLQSIEDTSITRTITVTNKGVIDIQ